MPSGLIRRDLVVAFDGEPHDEGTISALEIAISIRRNERRGDFVCPVIW